MKEINLENKNKIAFHFDITLVCNNRCPYCYIGMNLDNQRHLNLETIKNTISALKDLKIKNSNYEIELIFVGGEPLLVIDNIIDVMKQLKNYVTSFQIFSNLNFPKNFEAIQKVKNLRKEFKNFIIKFSWHDVSDENNVKRNLKELEDFTCVTFLVQDENFERTCLRHDWVRDNTIADINFEEIRDDNGNSFFSKSSNSIYKEMIKNSKDSEFFDVETSQKDLEISKRFHTFCQISQMCITFDGDLTPMCFNPEKLGNIKNGINIKTMYCNNYHCRNVTTTYKKIGPKK